MPMSDQNDDRKRKAGEMERHAERKEGENRQSHEALSGSGTGSGDATAPRTDRSTVENMKEGLIRAGANPEDAADTAAPGARGAPGATGATGVSSGLQPGGTK